MSRLASTCTIGGTSLSAAHTRQLLGQSFHAVVLDLHDGIAADTLGRCHGLVRGGGALILCLPPTGCAVLRTTTLAVHPYTSADVGNRFWQRLEQDLARNLALQLELLAAEGERGVEPELRRLLLPRCAR